MFTIENYIEYLKTHMKLSYFSNPNSKYSEEVFIQALTDFTSNYINILGARPGDKLKSLLPILSSNKPKSVSYNTWFLYNYGYKYCSACKVVKPINDYSSNIATWNQLSSICKLCDNARSDIYKNTHKEQANKTYRLWYEQNKHIRAAATAKRRANKLLATPVWLTEEHKTQILVFYAEAKKLEKVTGVKYQVDHIIPLQGETVCGLHVPWNLQLLTVSENASKNNRYDSDY